MHADVVVRMAWVQNMEHSGLVCRGGNPDSMGGDTCVDKQNSVALKSTWVNLHLGNHAKKSFSSEGWIQ